MVESVSLNDVLATILVLRILIVVGGFFPLVMMASPFLFGIVMFLLDFFTSKFGFISIVGTIALTIAGRTFISVYAPSPKHRDDTYRKSSFVLPILSFWTFQAILHLVLVPLFSMLGFSHLLRMSPKIPYLGVIRIAISAFLYGCTVLIRFVGPVSVMRCSAFPVLASPLISSIRSFWSKCTSFDAFIAMIAAPSDTPGVLLDSPFKPNISKGRRHQTPPITTGCLLLGCSLLLSWMAAKLLNYPISNSFQSEVYVNASWLTVFNHLFMTCLDGKSHELSPERYHQSNLRSLISHSQIEVYLYSTALAALISPLSLHVVTNSGDVVLRWNLVVHATLVSIVISTYLSVIDLLARNFLCATGFELRQLIMQVTSDPNPCHDMDVIVKSLVFDDSGLASSVMSPPSGQSTISPEEEEVYRHKEDSAKMVNLLTKVMPDFGLADDILRVLILESLGGGNPDYSVDLEASTNHHGVVEMLVSTGLVAPIVRALCAYVAGLGIAIKDIEIAKKTNKSRFGISEAWALPPGALTCSERALVGATHCVLQAISSSRQPVAEWRDTQLSVFVPVLFMSAFHLRSGIEAYANDFMVRGTKCSVASYIANLEKACDACAIALLNSLQSRESRALRLAIPLNDCHDWLEQLIDQHNASLTNAPVLIRENDKQFSNSITRALYQL